MTKPNREQIGLYNIFNRYVKDDGTIIHPEFAKDIEALRKYKNGIEILSPNDGTADTPSPFAVFLNKYKFPTSMHAFLYHYVVYNEIKLDKLEYGVYIVDEDAKEASGKFDANINYIVYCTNSLTTKYVKLTIAIPLDATNLQIRNSIKEAKEFIGARQIKVNGGKIPRKRYVLNAERNNWILDQHNKGLKPKQILDKLPKKWQNTIYTSQDISDIISHNRQRQ